MQYQEFDDWFLEIENYGTRSERFYELFDHYKVGDNLGLQANLLVWLKAAWDSARMEGCEYCNSPELSKVAYNMTCTGCMKRMTDHVSTVQNNEPK